VESIRQFHHDDTDVVDHGQQHFPHALGLALLAGVKVQLGQFRNAIDAPSDIVAEALPYIFDGNYGVFDRIVEESGFETNQIHRHITEDMGHFEGVSHIGLAGGTGLAGVVEGRVLKGLAKGDEAFLRAQFAVLNYELFKARRQDWINGTKQIDRLTQDETSFIQSTRYETSRSSIKTTTSSVRLG
jgi:hypothetical protein